MRCTAGFWGPVRIMYAGNMFTKSHMIALSFSLGSGGRYWGHIGIMEKKMETIGDIGVL